MQLHCIFHFCNKNCNSIQYADDTMIFNSHNHLTETRNSLQQTIEILVKFFESYQLTINANETEFICFSKPSKNEVTRSHTLKVKNQSINTSTTVKHLGDYLDQNLKIQDEVNNNLRHQNKICYTWYYSNCDKIIITQCFSFQSLHCYILITGISENFIINLEQLFELGNQNLFQYI